MKYFTSFCKPTFFVCQTGTVVKEIEQAGYFDALYVKKLKYLAAQYGLAIKEHNADYITKEEVLKRKNLVAAQNVAPQLGVMQTLITINKAITYGLSIDDFLAVSYKSKRWRKWLYKNTEKNLFLCSIIAGHYCFSSNEYKSLYKGLMKRGNINQIIEKEVHNLIDTYLLSRP